MRGVLGTILSLFLSITAAASAFSFPVATDVRTSITGTAPPRGGDFSTDDAFILRGTDTPSLVVADTPLSAMRRSDEVEFSMADGSGSSSGVARGVDSLDLRTAASLHLVTPLYELLGADDSAVAANLSLFADQDAQRAVFSAGRDAPVRAGAEAAPRSGTASFEGTGGPGRSSSAFFLVLGAMVIAFVGWWFGVHRRSLRI